MSEINSCTMQTPIGVLYIEENGSAITKVSLVKTDLPLAPAGTAFQQKVWQELRKIPYGENVSYGENARRIGNPKACRAVGGENNKNPILIMIHCHRCIGANGVMVGFGCGIKVKEQLLDLEKQN